MKVCSKCGIEKDASEFPRAKQYRDGLRSWCKVCNSAYQKAYQKAYRENNKEKRATCQKAYRENNKEKRATNAKVYRANNKERISVYGKVYGKTYYENNREKRIASMVAHKKKRRATDPLFRLHHIIGCRIRSSIKRFKSSKKGRTNEYIGCDIKFLKAHLEAQFTEGMSWDNQREWHIDHYVPQSYFRAEDVCVCWNWRNLRPLWAAENLAKSDILPDDYREYIERIKNALDRV